MNGKIRRLAVLLAAVVFVGSGVMVGWQYYQYHLGAEAYSQAETLAGVPDLSAVEQEPEDLPDLPVPLAQSPEEEQPAPVSDAETETAPSTGESAEEKVVWVDPYADALAAMDFAALREVNPEVLGWIVIPGTQVSYPLMQGTDNQKYLKTTWRGSRSSVGAIFLECRNSADLSDHNTIVYGHRMANGSMFGSLKNYAKQSYWSKHPYVYITDDNGCKTYAVFAAYEVGVTEQTYRVSGWDGETRQAFLDFCTARSEIDTGITPGAEDQILTLSTCTGRGHETRWVVQAVLVNPG